MLFFSLSHIFIWLTYQVNFEQFDSQIEANSQELISVEILWCVMVGMTDSSTISK
jgi:hypothetical protein